MRVRFLTMLILSVFATTSLQSPAHSDEAIREPHSIDQIIVTYKDGTSSVEAVNTQRRVSTRSTKSLHRDALSRTDVLQVGPGISVESAIATLQNDPNVLYAEPDYLLQKAVIPNDPGYLDGSLWGMSGNTTSPSNNFGSQAAEAWNAGYTGSSTVVVGVIDEGIQITHPDLAANIWVNPNEIPNNSIDDDGNGKIDDINGWDFLNGDAGVFDGTSNPAIDAHGTHVSGTIGAVGNNGIGVAGVNWNVQIVSAKFIGPAGGANSNAILAIDYLTNLKKSGVNLVAINNSYGGGGFSQAMQDAINRAGDQGIFFVAAAGNGNLAGVGQNNDVTASYPSNYDCTKTAQGAVRNWDCVIAVASIASNGSRSTFSNYGLTKVDIGAPGEGIWSTVPNNSYANYSGTSMATPHVTGAIALCASVNPTITSAQIRSVLMSSATPTPSLNGRVVTGGRLDVSTFINLCLSAQDPLAISNTVLSGVVGTPIALSTTGGSGTIAPTFTFTGANCAIDGSNLNASGAATCVVTATNPANGIYRPAVSPSKTFIFSLAQQEPLVISSSTLPQVWGTPITLSTTGGSGFGAISFGVTGSGCSVTRGALSATSATLCTVTATKAAYGIYDTATSAEVIFTFMDAPQSPLRISNTGLNGVAGTAISLSIIGGSGEVAPTYSVTGSNCSLVGSNLYASGVAACVVTATNPANGVYAAAISAPVIFNFANVVVPGLTPNSPTSITPQLLPQTLKALPLSMKKNRTLKISAMTNQGNRFSIQASGSCKVTKIFTIKNKKKILSKFAIKTKSKSGICSVNTSASAYAGYAAMNEVKAIVVK